MNSGNKQLERTRKVQARMKKLKQQTLEFHSCAQHHSLASTSHTQATSPVQTTSHGVSQCTSRIMSKLKREKSLYQQTIQKRKLTRARRSTAVCNKCDCKEQRIIRPLQKKSLKQGRDDHFHLTRSRRSLADGCNTGDGKEGRILRRHKQELLKQRSSGRNSLMRAKRSSVDVCNTNDTIGGRRTSSPKKKCLKHQNASRYNFVRARRNSSVECHNVDCTKEFGPSLLQTKMNEVQKEVENLEMFEDKNNHCVILCPGAYSTVTDEGEGQRSRNDREGSILDSERPRSPCVKIKNVEEDFVVSSASSELARSKSLPELQEASNVSVSQDFGVTDMHSLSLQPMNTVTEINIKETQCKQFTMKIPLSQVKKKKELKKWEIRNDGLLIATSQKDCSKSTGGKNLAVKMQPLSYQKIICTLLPCVPLDGSMAGIGGNLFLTKYNSLKASFVMFISEDLLARIRNSRKPGQESYGIQVLVRMCVDDSSCVQKDAFPDCNTIIKVNSYIKTCVMNDKTKKYDIPVDITQCCLDSDGDPQDASCSKITKPPSLCLSVEWKNDKKEKNYCVTVVIAEELSAPQIISKLLKKHVKPPSMTEKMVKELFNSYSAKGLSCTRVRTSLNCPLGKTRIVTPCRGISCTHIQCVDALTLLNMNEGRSVNNKLCFLCNQVMDSIYVDEFFLNILQSEQTEEVIFCEDGSWYMVTEGTETQQVMPVGTKTTLSAEAIDKTEHVVCPATSHHKCIEKSKSRCSTEAEENIKLESKVSGSINILSHLDRLQSQVKKLEGLHEDHNKVHVIDTDDEIVQSLKSLEKDSLVLSEHDSDNSNLPKDCGSSDKSREISNKTNMDSNVADIHVPNEVILDLTTECTESSDMKANLSVNKANEEILDLTLEQEKERGTKNNVLNSRKPNTSQLKDNAIETQQRIKSVEDEISRLLKLSEFTKHEHSWLFPGNHTGKRNPASVETRAVNDTNNTKSDIVPGKRKLGPEADSAEDAVNYPKVKNCSVVLERLTILEKLPIKYLKSCRIQTAIAPKEAAESENTDLLMEMSVNTRIVVKRTKNCTDDIDSQTTTKPNMLSQMLQDRPQTRANKNCIHRTLMVDSKRAGVDLITQQCSMQITSANDNRKTPKHSQLKSDQGDSMETQESSVLKSHPSDSIQTQESGPSDSLQTQKLSLLKSCPIDGMKNQQHSLLKSGPSDSRKTRQSSSLKSGPSDSMKTQLSSRLKSSPSDSMTTWQPSLLKSGPSDSMKTRLSSQLKSDLSMTTRQSSLLKSGPSDSMKTRQSCPLKSDSSDSMKTSQSSLLNSYPSDSMTTRQSSSLKSGPGDSMKTQQSSPLKSSPSDGMKTRQSCPLKSDSSDSMTTWQSSLLKLDPSDSMKTSQSSLLNSYPSNSMTTQQSSSLKSGPSDSMKTQQSSPLKSGPSDSKKTRLSSQLKSDLSMTTRQSSLLKSGPSDSMKTLQSSTLKLDPSDSMKAQQSCPLKSDSSDSMTTLQSSLLKSGPCDSMKTRQSAPFKFGPSDSMTILQFSQLKSGPSDSMKTRQSSLLKSALLKSGPSDIMTTYISSPLKSGPSYSMKTQQSSPIKSGPSDSMTILQFSQLKSGPSDSMRTQQPSLLKSGTNDSMKTQQSSPLKFGPSDSMTTQQSSLLKTGPPDDLQQYIAGDTKTSHLSITKEQTRKKTPVASESTVQCTKVTSSEKTTETVEERRDLGSTCEYTEIDLTNDEINDVNSYGKTEFLDLTCDSETEMSEISDDSDIMIFTIDIENDNDIEMGCVNSVPDESRHASVGDLSNQLLTDDITENEGNIEKGKVIESHSNKKTLQTKHDIYNDTIVSRSTYSGEIDEMQTTNKLQNKDSTPISEVSEPTCQCNMPLRSQSCEKCKQYVAYIVKRNKQLVPVTLTSESSTKETDLEHAVQLHNKQLRERIKESKKVESTSSNIVSRDHDKDQLMPTSQKRNNASKHFEHSRNQCDNNRDSHMEDDEFTCRKELIRRRKQINRERRKLIVDRETTMKQSEIDANQFFHYQTSQRPELAPSTKTLMRASEKGINMKADGIWKHHLDNRILDGPLKHPGISIPSIQLQRLFYRNTTTNLDEVPETVMEDQTANQAELR